MKRQLIVSDRRIASISFPHYFQMRTEETNKEFIAFSFLMGRLFHSLWKGLLTSSNNSCVCRSVHKGLFLSMLVYQRPASDSDWTFSHYKRDPPSSCWPNFVLFTHPARYWRSLCPVWFRTVLWATRTCGLSANTSSFSPGISSAKSRHSTSRHGHVKTIYAVLYTYFYIIYVTWTHQNSQNVVKRRS